MYNHSEPVRVDLGMALIHLDLDEKVSVLEVGFPLKKSVKNHNNKKQPNTHKYLAQCSQLVNHGLFTIQVTFTRLMDG